MQQSHEETEDLTGTCWRDDLWLQHYTAVSTQSALDYFSLSPFYDKTCNNEVARQRGLSLDILPSLSPGIEYALQDSQAPHLFVIKKVFREKPDVLKDLAYYYILDGTIYQAPQFYAALQARVKRCAYGIQGAFNDLQTDLDPLVLPDRERILEAALEKELAMAEMKAVSTASLTQEQLARTERNIASVLRNHPLPLPSALTAVNPANVSAGANVHQPAPSAGENVA